MFDLDLVVWLRGIAKELCLSKLNVVGDFDLGLLQTLDFDEQVLVDVLNGN